MAAHESTISGTLIICGAPQPAIRAARQARLGGWPERVILLEPLGASKLGAAAPLLSAPGIEVIPALPGPADGEADLTLYSLPGLRGLSPALPVLQELFPGLSIRETRPIETISATTLLERLGPVSGPVHLWIDMPGAEATTLDVLETAGLLAQAESMTLRCGDEPFFEGGSACAALRDRLVAMGFEMALRDDSDPDWPDMVMHQDLAAKERARLQETLASREAELQELRGVTGLQATELEAREAALNALEEQHAATLAEVAALRESAAQQEETLGGLTQDLSARDGTIREMQGQLAGRDLMVNEHAAEIQRLTAESEAQTQQIADQKAELDAFVLHVAELQALVETRDQQLVARDSEIERLGNEVQAGGQRAEQLQAELAARTERVAVQAKEIERLKSVVETGRAQITEQRQKLSGQTAALETGAQRVKVLEVEVEGLTTAVADRTQRMQGLEKELSVRTAKVQELQKNLSDRDARNAKLVEDVTRLTNELGASKKQVGATQEKLTARQTEITRLTGVVQESRQTINTLREGATALEAKLSETQAARDAAVTRLDQTQADQALQMRMQVMHKLDLDDLRTRYEKSEALRRQQEELLRKLTPRLAQAAEQLRHLQLPADDVVAPALLVDPAPKPKSKSKSKAKAAPKRKKASKPTKRSTRKGDAK